MMKKIFSTLATGCLLGLFALSYQSCNYLDIDEYINDMQSLDTVFQKKETTEEFLYHTYSYLVNPGKSWEDDGVPWVLCSDEAFGTEDVAYNDFCTNQFDASKTAYSKWKHYYEAIRTASIFLNRIGDCKELTAIQLREYTGEAQFLKAYYYFELMKQYGPVCMVPESGFKLDQPMSEILIPRNTWDECVDYVAGLLKQAAQNLPDIHPSNDWGKPTKGAAYAVLSRLLLYHASPLFNGNTSYADFVNSKTGTPYINQEYQEEKWAQAAAAAKKVINNSNYNLHTEKATEGKTPALPVNVTSDPDFYKDYPDGAAGIDPLLSYSEIFNGGIAGSTNEELIFAMAGVNIDRDCAPVKMRGRSLFNIPQKLVDAYYMVNGKTTEEGKTDPDYPYQEEKSGSNKNFSGYILSKGTYGHYLNREMRFYATIGFSNSYYFGTSSTGNSANKNFNAQFYKNGNCAKGAATWATNANYYPMTGYLCRKFQHPEDVYGGSYYGALKPKVWAEYRLAEIYLNYVEALNELTISHTVDNEVISRDPAEIRKYFNLIRYRAGLPGISTTDAQNPVRMKELIKRERQIELAWEGHRYFDTRRWNIAKDVENGHVTGLAVYKDEDDGFYREVQVKEVSFAYKTYSRRKNFWPIPQTEITKNPNLDQNPGW